MRVWLSLKQRIVPLMCGLSCLGLGAYALYVTFSIRECSVQLDPLLSSGMQYVVNKSIRAWSVGSVGLSRTVATIQEKFPFFDVVSARLVPCGRLAVSCRARQPRCGVGVESVLLEGGVVAPRYVFNEQAVASLPVVQVAEWCVGSSGLPTKIPDYLSAIDDEILARYQVTWRGEHEIELREYGVKDFSIVTSAADGLDTALLETCNQLRNTVKNRSAERWVADVRFKNQIVLFSERMRRGYGTNTF